MDSSNDSDVSEGMRDLIDRGFAFKRDSDNSCPVVDPMGDTRGPVRDLDVSRVHRPLTSSRSADVASTHGLTSVAYESATAAGRNIEVEHLLNFFWRFCVKHLRLLL